MTSIRRRAPVASVTEWPEALHPVLKRVFSRRELQTADELEFRLRRLIPVGRFDALAAAVELLLDYRDRTVVIVGDFDADGATSTALMVLALRALGFARVEYFIPDRFALGYGLSVGAVAALADHDSALIVTVDNGISSHEGVAAAKARGFDVLVTDHHLPPETLPPADVIVNPNVPDESFPGGHLAGVGVAFYLIAALGRALGQAEAASEYLDLVALGTVADLVPLDDTNRILVEQGLRRIRAGRCRPGLLALGRAAGIAHGSIVASTLAYQLAPRLNAAGRLDDMSLGVRCLVTESRAEADRLAAELDRLNRSRRAIEARMKAEAVALVDGLALGIESELPATICICREDWHEGVVGLIAGRIRERYGRPTFAFAPAGDGSLKGSGRSIPGFHLRDALADVDSRHPGLIDRFGGHAMAAGLSLARANLADFEEAVHEVSVSRIGAADLQQTIFSDGALEAEHMTLSVATILREAAPWGQGFPEPCFDGSFELVDSRVLKEAHLKLRLKPAEGGGPVDAIAFNQAGCDWPKGSSRRIAYRLSVNDYFSEPRVQLVVEYIDNDA